MNADEPSTDKILTLAQLDADWAAVRCCEHSADIPNPYTQEVFPDSPYIYGFFY